MTSSLETECGFIKGKDKEVNEKVKYKQKKKDASYNKQRWASDEGNKHTVFIVLKPTMFLGCIRTHCPHRVQKPAYTKNHKEI